MANRNNPNGFTPFRHGSGGEIRTETITLNSSNSVIGVGDALVQDTSGTWNRWTSGTRIDGVAAQPAAANAGGTIQAYTDPQIIFEAQTDDGTGTGTLQDAMTLNATIIGGTPVNQRSIMEIDESSAAVTLDLPLKIVGLSPRAGNAFGEFNRLLVMFNYTARKSPGTLGI